MSNDRHLTIDDGTMGSLFRRVTLATLGLDSLDGVSEQSFEVIDRADTFAARLLGGVSSVMPKIDVERLGTQSSDFAEHLCNGMSGLNGPKSATDLGEWQYWLDAALLMLFDEDDEEAEALKSSQSGSNVQALKRNGVAANANVVRSRVAALKKTGITPAMLQAIPQSAKKAMVQELKKVQSVDAEERSAEIAAKLSQTLKKAIETSGYSVGESAIGRIFTENSRQSFASHIADKAMLVSSELASSDSANSDEVAGLTQRWSQSIQKIGTRVQNDMSAVREMLSALDGLEKCGAVSREHAEGLRAAGSSYARRVLMSEISNDASAIASRMERLLANNEKRSMNSLVSSRAMTMTSVGGSVENAAEFKRAFAALSERLSDFSSAVNSRVLTDGETAATVRWNRAADRFVRLQGVSDDIDRVLLRDVNESVVELGKVGIVPQSMVESVIKSSSKLHDGELSKASSLISNTNHEMSEVLAHFGASRILGGLASRIENSIDNLVREVTKSGIAGTGVETFVSDIRQLLSTGHADTSVDSAKATSVIESICARLDDFAELTAAGIVTNGYDELTSETIGTYVSANEEKSENAESVTTKFVADNSSIKAVQQIQKALMNAKAQAQEQMRAFVSSQKVSPEYAHLVSEISNASTIESLISAQKALVPHLDAAASSELQRTVDAVQRSQKHLDSVSKQVQLIENTLKVSSRLRTSLQVSESGISTSNSVKLDDVRINSQYLSALGSTLKSYAKLRDDLSAQMSDGSRWTAGMTESRLEHMLSTIKPESATIKSEFGAKDFTQSGSFAELSHSEVVLGYDDVVPEGMEWIRQNAQSQQYPSNSTAGSLETILGSRKAIELHTADMIGGRTESVKALADALSNASKRGMDVSSITPYVVANDGSHVKVSFAANQNKAETPSYQLRQHIGEAYMPASQVENSSSAVQAKVSVANGNAGSLISGVDEFVPVTAGVNAQDVQNNASAEAHDAVQSILGRLGIQVSGAAFDSASDKFRMTVGGVDFEMTANDFVHMVAKPSMSSTAANAPSMFDASNSLFAGYASMLSNAGEKRSLKTLRNAYIDTMARSGELSAHSDLGFNTQSFTKVMGLNQKPQISSAVRTDDAKSAGIGISAHAANSSESSNQFADEMVASRERQVSSEVTNSSDFAWVSNQLSSNVSSTHVRGTEASSDNAHQLLGRIDNMLDYVENLSERNVGVFSTDETVRVLLEALPAEGQLGNKGLPKWRQKDTRAARAAEAKELRDALAKIGATPVQGVQRFANKQYVSPNLLQDQASGATPLFSSGDEGSTTPKASANASNSGSNAFTSSSIKDEDLQFIAEEVFHKIEESLNEEHQRRRSE